MDVELPNLTSMIASAEKIKARILAACERSRRNCNEITMIWVCKNHPLSSVLLAHEAGARNFGENRVQEALEKFPLPKNVEGKYLDYSLHLIGTLQRNKIRKILPFVKSIHSVDTPELWEAIDRIAGELSLQPEIFLQVNTSRESQKGGFSPETLLETLGKLPIAKHMHVLGLMTMGPMDGNLEATRKCFSELRLLLQKIQNTPQLAAANPKLNKLSMGMSGDFEIAIEEGSHFVRIGTALFGERITQ